MKGVSIEPSIAAGYSGAEETPQPRRTHMSRNTQYVVIEDIRMSFGAMVVFMVKWAIASIPAAIILMLIVGALSLIAGGIFGGILDAMF